VLPEVSPAELVAILGLALGLEAIKACEQLLVVRPLGFARAFVALETAAAATNLIPGPSGTATRFVLYRSWGFSSADFARGWMITSSLNNLLVLVLPVVGAVLVVTTSDVEPSSTVVVLAAIGLIVAAVGTVIAVEVLRRESFARRVGELSARVLRFWRGLRHKPSGADAVDAILRFRVDAIASLREHGVLLCATIVAKYALTALLLWLSLHAVGVPNDALSPAEVFAGYTFVRLLTIVNITPGGVGVAEALYIAVLTYLANDEIDDAVVVAGVLIFRAATYALPIALGAGTYVTWRLKKSWRAEPPASGGADSVVAAAVDRPVEDDPR